MLNDLVIAFLTDCLLQKVTKLLTYDYKVPGTCNNFQFGTVDNPRTPIGDIYATEHILELQMVAIFLDKMNDDFGRESFPSFMPNAGSQKVQGFCQAINQLWRGVPQRSRFAMDGETRDPIDHIMPVFSSNDNTHVDEFVLLEKGVNTAKEGMWGRKAINSDDTMNSYMQSAPDRAVKNLKDVMTALRYMQDSTINTRLIAEKERVGARLKELDEDKMPNWARDDADGNAWGRWERKDLQGKWNQFMKQQAENAKDKAVRYMTDNLRNLEDAYVTPSNEKLADMPGEENETLKTLLEKIKKIREEWDAYKPNAWGNPFS